MVLGMTYLELFVVIGIGAAMFGTRDLPKMGKAAGRITGWAVGTMLKARGQFQTMTAGSQLAQMHKELQESMYELEQIRNELRMGAAFMRPGTMMHRVRTAPGRSPSAVPSSTQTASSQPTAANHKETGQGHVQGKTDGAGPHLGGFSREEGSDARLQHLIATMGVDAATAVMARASSGSVSDTGHGAGAGGARRSMVGQDGKSCGGLDSMRGTPRQKMPDQVAPLPISAVSAGVGLQCDQFHRGADIMVDALMEESTASADAVELRGDELRGGGDVMVDALTEEDIAKSAQKFVEVQEGDGATNRA